MPQPIQISDKMLSTVSTANSTITLTIPAAGAGIYHYITSIVCGRNATAALTGTATLTITSTNLPGTPSWTVGNAMAAGGTQKDVELFPATPIKSSVANTATTIVYPACGAAVLSNIVVTYYVSD